MSAALPLLVMGVAFLVACFIYALANDFARLTHHPHQQRGEGERGGVNHSHKGAMQHD